MASTKMYGGSGAPVTDQSLGELMATVSRDLSELLHKEVELAKTELATAAKRAGAGAGLLGGAGVLGYFALVLFSFAAAFAVAEGGGVPLWAGFLCIGGLYGGLAGALGALGVLNLMRLRPPTRSIHSVKTDLAWAKRPTTVPPRVDLEELRASHQ
ncbi:MAG TPA: phage holin family protein [Mycobacteriales bacterium]|nr:phage holin family protein [Mycobacteriales bacterium]